MKRPLEKAAAALEEIRSQFHRIRVQIHLELAKCEIDDDLLVKVISHVLLSSVLFCPVNSTPHMDIIYTNMKQTKTLCHFFHSFKKGEVTI